MINKLNLVLPDNIPKGQIVNTDNLPDIWNMFKQLENICIEHNGIGLSAVQLGIPLNAFVVLNGNGEFDHFINCDYVGIGGKKELIEGCLSLRNHDGSLMKFKVSRFKKISFFGKKIVLDNKFKIISFSKMIDDDKAIVYQHEIDHQKLILISNIGERVE